MYFPWCYNSNLAYLLKIQMRKIIILNYLCQVFHPMTLHAWRSAQGLQRLHASDVLATGLNVYHGYSDWLLILNINNC